MSAQTAGGELTKWTFGRVVRYGTGVGGFLWLGEKAYESGGNVHRFEYSIISSLKRLPFYPPPVPAIRSPAEEIEKLRTRLPAEIEEKFGEWFIAEDARKKLGVLRQDVIEFIEQNANLVIEESVLKSFLEKGRGRGPEEQRLSSCSLLGGFLFLADVVKTNSAENVHKSKRKLSGEDQMDEIQMAVIEKEKTRLLSKGLENLSEAEQARLQQLNSSTSTLTQSPSSVSQ